MKLWKISQYERIDYDTYDEAVVAAETEDEAKLMHPDGGGEDIRLRTSRYRSWANDPRNVSCEYLGEARDGMPKGVVCASFNAG